MFLRQRRELLVVRARRAGAGRVVRVVVVDDGGAPPVGRRHHVQVGQEGAPGHERQGARRPPGEEDRALVDRIGRVGKPAERPSGIERRKRQMEQRLLRPLARQDLPVRVEREPEPALQVTGDRLAQRGDAPHGRILRHLRHRGLERLADERRRRLARIADAEVVERSAAAQRRLALHVGLLLQISGELAQEGIRQRLHPAFTTGLRKTPTPSTSISTVSPAWMGPTPSGVPVVTTSPGSRVMPAEMNARSAGIGKI